jgi:hypothetical protein
MSLLCRLFGHRFSKQITGGPDGEGYVEISVACYRCGKVGL